MTAVFISGLVNICLRQAADRASRRSELLAFHVLRQIVQLVQLGCYVVVAASFAIHNPGRRPPAHELFGRLKRRQRTTQQWRECRGIETDIRRTRLVWWSLPERRLFIAVQGPERSPARCVERKRRPLAQDFDKIAEDTALQSVRAIHFRYPSMYTHRPECKNKRQQDVQQDHGHQWQRWWVCVTVCQTDKYPVQNVSIDTCPGFTTSTT